MHDRTLPTFKMCSLRARCLGGGQEEKEAAKAERRKMRAGIIRRDALKKEKAEGRVSRITSRVQLRVRV